MNYGLIPFQAQPEPFVMQFEVLNSLHLGIFVVSPDLQPIYLNERAHHLCETLFQSSPDRLPQDIAAVCQQFLGLETPQVPLVVEYQPSLIQWVRLHVSLMKSRSQQPSSLLVVVEDCCEVGLHRDQKAYGLTKREAQVWMLLRSQCTYQEIADQLKISLNTVKTHAKNVYLKRREFVKQRASNLCQFPVAPMLMLAE